MSRLCGIDYTAPSGRLLWRGPETQGAALGWIKLAFQAGMSGAITGGCPLRAAGGYLLRT